MKEHVCFTEVTLYPPEGESFNWEFEDEDEQWLAYTQIIDVLGQAAIELYEQEPDVRHLPYIQVPIIEEA